MLIKNKKTNTTSLKEIFINSLIVTSIFMLTYFFYNIEFVRANVEDIAYDTINKFIINKKEVKVKSPNIFILAVDDNYMKVHKLYDKDKYSNYGYIFPRDQLANIIESVDVLSSEIDEKNVPKALFLDYDMDFTTMPYGKSLSREDQKFINILKAPRPYIILLPKSGKYNFVQYSKDNKIQQLIKEKKIVFVSVDFLRSKDDATRRYKAYSKIKEVNNIEKPYINVDVLLWYLLRHKKLPEYEEITSVFKQDDIIANRIKIKSYKKSYTENNCSTSYSYWKNLTKLSANCNLFEIDEEDYANSIIMVGGTHSNNDDNFETLDVVKKQYLTGIDLHANTLLTLLSLNVQTKQLTWIYGSLIVFITFFITSLFISKLILFFKLYNKKIEFVVTLFINTTVLVAISVYLLLHYNLWFNWFVPLIVFQTIEIIDLIKDYTPKFVHKLKGKKR